MKEGPVYDHGCIRCRFLGTTGPTWGYPKANAVDHYFCEGVIGGGTLIQRGGSDGPNYRSFPIDVCRDGFPDHWAPTLALFDEAERNSLALLCA